MMEHFKKVIMEKHAGWISNMWGKLGPVKRYRYLKTDPLFKTQKAIGTAALALSPIAYIGHKMSSTPEMAENQLEKKTIPGVPPSYQ